MGQLRHELLERSKATEAQMDTDGRHPLCSPLFPRSRDCSRRPVAGEWADGMAADAIATRRATSWALALSGVAGAFAADAHAAIRSSRGVQHQTPMISDDFIVGCIMVMFLCLFAFGTRRSVETMRCIAHRCTPLTFAHAPIAGKQ